MPVGPPASLSPLSLSLSLLCSQAGIPLPPHRMWTQIHSEPVAGPDVELSGAAVAANRFDACRRAAGEKRRESVLGWRALTKGS